METHPASPERIIDPGTAFYAGSEGSIHGGEVEESESQATVASEIGAETLSTESEGAIDPGTAFYVGSEGSIHGGTLDDPESQDTVASNGDTVASDSDTEASPEKPEGDADPGIAFSASNQGSIHGGEAEDPESQATMTSEGGTAQEVTTDPGTAAHVHDEENEG